MDHLYLDSPHNVRLIPRPFGQLQTPASQHEALCSDKKGYLQIIHLAPQVARWSRKRTPQTLLRWPTLLWQGREGGEA